MTQRQERRGGRAGRRYSHDSPPAADPCRRFDFCPPPSLGMLLLAYTYMEERAAAASQLQNTARAMSIVVDGSSARPRR